MPDYRSSIVSILKGDTSEPLGTGFLISANQILTCAHVVLSDSQLANGLNKSREVRLAFFVDEGKTPRRASVDPEFTAILENGDYAVLTLLDPAPHDAKPLRLASSRMVKKDQPLEFYGFPENFGQTGTDGGCLFFSYIPYTRDPSINLIHLSGAGAVDAGFSGAPLVVPGTDLAIGMLQFIPKSKYHRQGNESYGIGCEQLKSLCGNLNVINRRIFLADLPTYLLDRQTQDEDLLLAFRERIRKPDNYVFAKESLPIQGVCLLYGPLEERPHHYIERLEKEAIERIFHRGTNTAGPIAFNFEWPSEYSTYDDLILRLPSRIITAAQLENVDPSVAAVSADLYHKYNGPLVFWTIYESKDPDIKHVVDFFKFWSEWPSRTRDTRETVLAIMVMICPKEFSVPTWLKEYKSALKRCALDRRLCDVLFSPLQSVERVHFINWISRKDIQDRLDRMEIREKVEAAFPNSVTKIPLEELIDTIRKKIA